MTENSIWPTGDLETLGACPICHDTQRSIEHDKLQDRIFFAAPGEWTLWRCGNCQSAYLDPRPTEDAIHRAYDDYYTHDGGPETRKRSLISVLRGALANDYRNRRFAARFAPTLPGGNLLVRLLPASRARIDREMCYLELPREKDPRLVDIGSGNGGFLQSARDAGWSVIGIEPDPVAANVGRRSGLEIFPSLDALTSYEGRIAAITMAHVIEHVHDPIATLHAVSQLLVSGGQLFIETPNIDAPTHARFGRAWRGLEPPRHLVLFNRSSLDKALRDCGFEDLQWHDDIAGVDDFLETQSAAIAAGRNPYTGEQVAEPLDTSSGSSRVVPGAQEFLTVTARKRKTASLSLRVARDTARSNPWRR